MTPNELKSRTKAFAPRVIRLVDAMPRNTVGKFIGRQLLRSATSVGANYRAACGARSRAEFAAKLSIVFEGSDESTYWLEIVRGTELVRPVLPSTIIKEAHELVAIMLTSRKTAKTLERAVNRKSTIEN